MCVDLRGRQLAQAPLPPRGAAAARTQTHGAAHTLRASSRFSYSSNILRCMSIWRERESRRWECAFYLVHTALTNNKPTAQKTTRTRCWMMRSSASVRLRSSSCLKMLSVLRREGLLCGDDWRSGASPARSARRRRHRDIAQHTHSPLALNGLVGRDKHLGQAAAARGLIVDRGLHGLALRLRHLPASVACALCVPAHVCKADGGSVCRASAAVSLCVAR